MRVGVVIPFYQREPGILGRALASIAAQELPPGTAVEVVVVDDASPCPPGPDVAAVAMPPNVAVTLLAQANGGPGAARNRGLDHLAAAGCDAVAFLDSDDEWAPAHLREGLAALALGYGLYFCDNGREGREEEGDDNNAELARLRRPGEPGVAWLGDGGRTPALIGVENPRLLEAYLTAYCSQTSTVILSAALARAHRFDTRLRFAGEDHMFWLDLVLDGARAAVSSARHVRCGRGVNLFFSAFDFDGVGVVDRVGSQHLFWAILRGKLRRAGRGRLRDGLLLRGRQGYSYLFVRALLRGQRPSLALLRELARHDPLIVPMMPLRFLGVLPRRAALARLW